MKNALYRSKSYFLGRNLSENSPVKETLLTRINFLIGLSMNIRDPPNTLGNGIRGLFPLLAWGFIVKVLYILELSVKSGDD
jgi:hypothetical protein